jgi:hypothetical protein
MVGMMGIPEKREGGLMAEQITVDGKMYEVKQEYDSRYVWVQTDNGEKQVVRNTSGNWRFMFNADGSLSKDPASVA